MKNDKAYFIGFTTFALSMFLGSKWSPDYMEFVSNGNNFLYMVFFGISMIALSSLMDFYDKRKEKKQ